MTEPLHKKEKPVLTPPQGGLPQKSTSPLVLVVVIIGLLVLLALSAIVIVLLPKKNTMVANRNPPVQETSHKNDAVLPLDNPEDAETEQLLHVWLKSEAAAEAENIQEWGGKEYTDILNIAAQGDQSLRNGDVESARSFYREAIDALSLLLASKEDKLRSALVEGKKYLDQLDAEKALQSFQQAKLIDPGNEQALHGENRAKNLDQVLSLYRAGLHEEAEYNLEEAHQLLHQASQTDADFLPAREALERLDKKRREIVFREAMSRALAALEKKNPADADKALDEAEQIHPKDPALVAARKRSEDMHRSQRLQNLRIKAEQHIKAEDWGAVVAVYRKAMNIDSHVGFATIGLQEAEKRLRIDQAIKSIISRPDRLQDAGPLNEAVKVLERARNVNNPGKVLVAQMQTLSTLIQNASTTVNTIFRSDNETTVEIYHIGRFQPFLEKQLLLKPGTYTVVGRKPGFRDVRMSIQIEAEMSMPVFFIRCEEPI